MTPWIAWAVLVPLAGAVAALAAGPRLGRWVGVATAAGAVTAAFALARQVLAAGPLRHRVGGWGAPLGIDLVADGLSALLVVMTAVVGLAVSVHAAAYFQDPPGAGGEQVRRGRVKRLLFWPLWLFLWAALAALFLTRDVFNAYVTLELLGLSAVALVALAGDVEAVGAAARYAVLALLGSLAYLLGVGLLYAAAGTLDVDGLRAALAPGLVASAAGALVVAGLALKAALFPLHGWLPPAHARAPAPVSAILSALVVKAAFYLLVRWVGEVLPGAAGGATLLGGMGAAAILWGSVQAFRQARLKQVIAYSTVAQLGYLFLFFPLARALGPGEALRGAALFAFAHALAKAALFLAAGAVQHAVGSDRLEDLAGLGTRLPVTAAALAVASLSILALPPSGGFAGKWLLLSTAVRAGEWWWVAVMLAGGLLAAAYSFRVLERLIAPGRGEAPAHAPAAMQGAALALAACAVALGVVAWAPLGLLAAAPALGATP